MIIGYSAYMGMTKWLNEYQWVSLCTWHGRGVSLQNAKADVYSNLDQSWYLFRFQKNSEISETSCQLLPGRLMKIRCMVFSTFPSYTVIAFVICQQTTLQMSCWKTIKREKGHIDPDPKPLKLKTQNTRVRIIYSHNCHRLPLITKPCIFGCYLALGRKRSDSWLD